jgi:hypothetical protein
LIDCDTFIEQQFTRDECNDARDSRGINRIAIVRIRESLTQ